MTPLEARALTLRTAQNPDGGWGYFPGRRSWLEPTVFTCLALESDPAASAGLSRAWNLMRSWQLPDGSWAAGAGVPEGHWSTALAVTWHCVRSVYDRPFEAGVRWLLGLKGDEHRPIRRIARYLFGSPVEIDASLTGWPWRPDCTSWVEPTAHALMALKKAAHRFPGRQLRHRVDLGERMLLERRCAGGGWNYGNRRVYGRNLPAYPETTALALLGLQGRDTGDITESLAAAARLLQKEKLSPLARAWLSIALKIHGRPVAVANGGEAAQSAGIMLAALEILAGSESGHRVFGASVPA